MQRNQLQLRLKMVGLDLLHRIRRVAESSLHAGDTENFDKFSRRTVKVTKEQNAECRRLLQLMGVPVVEVS
jgi:5'-3' exonuclease